jgi:hypothetical protein
MKSITVFFTGAVAFAFVSLASAAAPLAGEATVYKQPNFSGAQLTLRGDTPNLAPQGFHDQASSLVLAGTWEFCSQPNYRGDCMTLGPGRYATLDPKLNHRIESARLVAAKVADTAPSQVTLFKGQQFTGAQLALRDPSINLSGQGFQNQASSAVVAGGKWEFCSQPEYRGDCVILEPGRYERLDQRIYHRMESVRPVGDAFPARERQNTALAQREERREVQEGRHDGREFRRGERGAIDLYPGAEFQGRPLRLEQDTETLDGSRMQERVSSIVVHDGTWQLCTRPAFEGRCRTFEPGRYGTLAGLDDRVASAKLLR